VPRLDFARAARDPRVAVLASIVVFAAFGFAWGLPASESWADDAISPRRCGLGAIVETYWPGHFHHYPPLHMAILTVVSLPWMALAILRAKLAGLPLAPDALEPVLIEPQTMTPIEVSSRLVSLAMLCGIAWNVMRLFERTAGRRVAVGAGAIVAVNSALLYYGRTGNLEVPYLFWSVWALVEVDRVLAGEPRETRALLLVAAALLTKDQAVGVFAFTLPACVAVRPSLLKSARLWKAAAIAALTFGLVSGAITNPTGFAKRMALWTGPASFDWVAYPATLEGRLALARDVVLAVPRFASWPLAIAAVAGLAIAWRSGPGLARFRALLPMVAATSATILATIGARRTEDRFLLVQSALFFPYAARALEALRSGPLRTGAWSIALAPALVGVASLDATLLTDSRYAAERFLAGLPEGARVELYGGSACLPRIPPQIRATRPGVEALATRSPIYRAPDVVDPPSRIVERRPDYVVLSTEFSRASDGKTPAVVPYGVGAYFDADSTAFFRDITTGALPYERVLRATCDLPWPLECRRIHGSTGEDVWIYARSPAPRD
jgi:hypothetical protein